jgi:hypothetical protein
LLKRNNPSPLHGRCSICEEELPLCLDHDHRTGEFRGWLCSHCNFGLGHFQDNMLVMAKAIGYVRGSR